jgi:hypothetical protein
MKQQTMIIIGVAIVVFCISISIGVGISSGGAANDCKAKNSNYVEKNADEWSNSDRNTAIWLINNINSSETVPVLQGLLNTELKTKLDKLCT